VAVVGLAVGQKDYMKAHSPATYPLVSSILAVITATIACSVLVGWLFDQPLLTALFPGFASMKAVT
jgi:hypothetical protein